MTLRVTIEMVPHGIEGDKRTLAVLDISNMGATYAHDEQCDYQCVATELLRETRRFQVWRHKPSDGWAKLVKRALYMAMDTWPNFGKPPL